MRRASIPRFWESLGAFYESLSQLTPMSLSPRILAAAIAVLVVVPVAAYQLGTTTASLALSLVSVAVIVGSLYTMFSPAEGSHA